MHTPESLCNVAVPADRLESRETFRELFRAQVFPLGGLEIRADQRGSVIEMMQWANWFMTEHTFLPFIPLRDDVPDEAGFGIRLNLLQAILAALRALRPAGAFV